MNQVLKDGELFSAHPTDEAALKGIFEVARIELGFERRTIHAEVLIGEFVRSRRVTARALGRAKRKIASFRFRAGVHGRKPFRLAAGAAFGRSTTTTAKPNSVRPIPPIQRSPPAS